MTVNEAIEVLEEIKLDGGGSKLFRLMEIEDGIPISFDIDIEDGHPSDGEKAWITKIEKPHFPEWLGKETFP